MDFHGFSWIFIDFHGIFFGFSWDFHGILPIHHRSTTVEAMGRHHSGAAHWIWMWWRRTVPAAPRRCDTWGIHGIQQTCTIYIYVYIYIYIDIDILLYTVLYVYIKCMYIYMIIYVFYVDLCRYLQSYLQKRGIPVGIFHVRLVFQLSNDRYWRQLVLVDLGTCKETTIEWTSPSPVSIWNWGCGPSFECELVAAPWVPWVCSRWQKRRDAKSDVLRLLDFTVWNNPWASNLQPTLWRYDLMAILRSNILRVVEMLWFGCVTSVHPPFRHFSGCSPKSPSGPFRTVP